MMPNQELNESGEKGTVTGIIFSKRKGGIYCHISIREYEDILIKKGRDFYNYRFIFMFIELHHQ